MNIVTLFVNIIIVLCLCTSCLAIVKPHSEIVLEIADLHCDEVWEGVLRVLKKNKIPLLVADKNGEYIETSPVFTAPLPGDSFQKMEEHYRIYIQCKKPLVTQITCQIKLRGLTDGHKWVEIKEAVKYEKRFLDNLTIH